MSDGTPIAGLPGAPVRTPVRQRSSGLPPRLWPAVAGRLVTRQAWIELYGMPGYRRTLPGGVTGLGGAPRDFRPVDKVQGEEILAGRFLLAGAAMEAEDPFDRPSPSRAFAQALHSFDWLPGLMSQGEAGARQGARLTLLWHAHFARWSPFAWDPEILARRAYNLAVAARRMHGTAAEADRPLLLGVVAAQGRQLLRPPGGVAGRAERAAAAAIVGCALSGPAAEKLKRVGCKQLATALELTVAADGSHASRSPEAGLELLLDLQTLEEALHQVSAPIPAAVTAAIQRLTRALEFHRLPDGRLPAFNGGGPSEAARVAAAHPGKFKAEEPSRKAVGGYVRLGSPLLSVVADAEAPPSGPWSRHACAQPLAVEILCGRDRLITNSGWTPAAPERQALRLTPGGSTLMLGDGSVQEPLTGWTGELLDARLDGPALDVTHDRRDGEGAVWLEIQHDGWKPQFGLLHQRRLYLDQRLDELRAEERLWPAPGHVAERPIAAPWTVRFHLEPGVSAELSRDRRSILLRGRSGRGWWFRTDGPDLAVDTAVHAERGVIRRGQQIVVRGSARTDAETKIRWKLSPAGATEG
ncbi:heparinase II/III family protein [Brevundimonas sp.]|uniref:heparinase II/III family protein n=1 Tax=Brevundimonas sp. TaxID=1871086 RepID=UPI0035AE7449